jgi:hypothetical protein
VDEAWAISVLEWWIDTVNKIRGSSYDRDSGKIELNRYVVAGSAEFVALRVREDQTRRVLARVLSLPDLPDILGRSTVFSERFYVTAGLDQAEYALGRLRTEAETRAGLGPSAPVMTADGLHPIIWEAASRRWESSHYSDAVQRAATALSGLVKNLTGRYELGDVDLMAQAFSASPPQAGKPRLRWPGNDSDLTVKAMRGGILSLAQGVFSAIRNPATHSTEELPEQEALEQLATLSMLARWIDQCEVVQI